jgi:uncharacterized protein YlxW (UPF0749 family)
LSEINQNLPDDIQFSGLEGHTEKEKQEILHEIDRLTEQNRLTVTDDLFKITPLKKGGTLPLIINIVGIIAILSSFYFTNRYFQAQEQTMALEDSSYESTEGSVIEELKRQAEEKLNQKQEEISQIQNELSKLDKESASLRENMDNQIKDKELELRQEMEAALADERARLQSQNISTADLERQLQDFQASRESSLEADITAFKNESAEAIRVKEEELEKAKQVANDILEQANREKALIEEDTQKREQELEKQFEAEKEALTRESSEATRKLQELSELQKNEQLIQDQLTGSYNTIISSIDSGNYTDAQIGIDDVRSLLEDPSVNRLPSIRKRLDVERFFLDTLEKEIKQAGLSSTSDFSSMTRAAEVLITARNAARLGSAAEAESNSYDAKRYYNEALSSLPQISRAVENLQKIEAADRMSHSNEYIFLGDQALNSGQISEAVQQYKAAATGTAPDNIESLTRAISGIETSLNNERDNIESAYEREYADLEKSTEASLAEAEKENEELLAKTEKEKEELLAEAEKERVDLLAEKENENEDKISEIKSKSEELISSKDLELEEKTTTIEGLTAELTTEKETSSSLNTELETTINSLSELETEKTDLEKSVSQLKTSEEELTNSVRTLTARVDESNNTIAKISEEARENAEKIETLNTEARRSAFAIENLSKKADRATSRAEELEEELNDAVNQIVDLIN